MISTFMRVQKSYYDWIARTKQYIHMYRLDIYSHNLKRKLFIKSEIKKKLCKSICKNNLLPFTYKYLSLYKKNKLFRYTCLPYQVNRCFITGRS